MTAATTIDTADRSSGRTERTSTRLAVALVVLLVAGVGVWGAGSTIQNVRAYEQTNRVEDAVAGARYALALERTAFRDPDTATARHGLSPQRRQNTQPATSRPPRVSWSQPKSAHWTTAATRAWNG